MKPLVVSKCENMDIEQNPGPPNHINLQENASVLLQGSIHQGDEIFSPDSRGRQCLPCCLVFLVKAIQKRICTNMWNVKNMNEILFAGDKLYKYANKNSKTYHDYLEPCALPSFFFTWQPALSLESEKKNIISSVEYPFLDLETALAMTFSFNPYAIYAWRTFNRVFKSSFQEVQCPDAWYIP